MINIEINIEYRSAVYGLGIRPEPGFVSPSPSLGYIGNALNTFTELYDPTKTINEIIRTPKIHSHCLIPPGKHTSQKG